MNYFIGALKNYATFSGRAKRTEYWVFHLCVLILLFLATVGDSLLGKVFVTYEGQAVIYTVVLLLLSIPSISVSVRRLHDIEKRGFWYFLWMIPIIGTIWMVILMCCDGTKGENRFGSDPRDTMKAVKTTSK